MSAVTRPRGPLPRRVYWVRRLVLLAVVAALVLGIARLLGGGAGADPGAARPVGATASSSAATTPASQTGSSSAPSRSPGPGKPPPPSPSSTVGSPSSGSSASSSPLAAPSGPCADSDVQVTPSVDEPAYAGHRVMLTLNLTTLQSPACTWEVSPSTVVLKLTSGQDRIWSTQDCRSAMPREAVVVRKDRITKVHVFWSGQRSDAECSPGTDWAMPGSYHAVAAALGSDPLDVQFSLGYPPAKTVTATPKPEKPAKNR